MAREARHPEFAERLKEACKKAGAPDKFFGRNVWLQDQVKEHGLQVSTETVSKWFKGLSKPRPEKMSILTDLLGLEPHFLDYGGQPVPSATANQNIIKSRLNYSDESRSLEGEPALTRRKFYKAEQEAGFVEAQPHTIPQTQDSAYRLAFRDTDFLLREELRPVRFQLELLKCEMLLDEAEIGSTLVVYGSARIPSPEMAKAALKTATTPERKAVIERLVAKSKYYEEARKLAHTASSCAIVENGMRQFVICSGGGPSIMEGANRGAHEAGAESIGLNIVLPREQAPNQFVTPSLSFQFHYFALRKMHFLLRARAVAVFPGGFGTFDELFELLTLVQTGKMKPIPILLFGPDYWRRMVNFEGLVEEGVISPEDLGLMTLVETAEEAWERIKAFYSLEC